MGQPGDFIPDAVTLTIGSYHIGAARDQFNEFNPGVIALWAVTDTLDFGVGAFYNSFEEWSPIVGLNKTFYTWDDFVVGGFIGAAKYDQWRPAGNLYVGYKAARLGYSHAWGLLEDTSGVIQFFVTHRF